eukprot:Seg53.3 transcript_id=Seg53.3/GoldUCD/mRNA.D3Y31 product="5-hydroxytryptamine receptor 1F" protein_id=Seg53.3/GoldUCD/D3Y31
MGNLLGGAEQSQVFYWSLIGIDTLTALVNFLIFAMFIYFRKTLLRSNHNRILCSLSLADGLVGCFGNNLGIILILKGEAIYYKVFGNIPMFSSMFTSVLSLMMLTADRLVAIKKPFIYSSHLYRRWILKLIIASWVIQAFITLQQTLIFVLRSKSHELLYRSCLFATFFTSGAILLSIANISLFVSLRKFARSLENDTRSKRSSGLSNYVIDRSYNVHPAEVITSDATADKQVIGVSGRENTNQVIEFSAINISPVMAVERERKNTRNESTKRQRVKVSKRRELKQTSIVCLLVVALFIVLWSPLAWYRFCYAIGISLNIVLYRRLALCLTVANSLLNPFIYLLVKKELRKYMKKMLRVVFCCRKQNIF